MSFCSNCGQQLSDGAKFCANCGTAVVSTAKANNSRKVVNDGALHKCPNCGELLSSFVSMCPSCGYELRNTTSGSAIKEFASKIELAETDEQRIRLIRNFTIPNTKEDILEFMILASTNADSIYISEEISNAWLVKLEQCYHKANLILTKDPDFSKIQSIYDKTHKRIKSGKLKKARNSVKVKHEKTSPGLMSSLIRAIPKTLGMIAGIAAFLVAISVDQAGENGVGYELVGGILLIISACMLGRKNVGFIEILAGAISGVLSFVLANQLDNGAFLQLVGFAVLVIVAINYFRALGRKKE